jgi:transcriptional regulator GlxA family with amidase domain
MLANVAVVVLDGVSPFELGVLCEVFGSDRTAQGLPGYDFAVVAGEPGPLRTETGFELHTPFGLERLEQADLVAVPATADRRIFAGAGEDTPGSSAGSLPGSAPGSPAGSAPGSAPGSLPGPLLEALRRTVDRGARVLSVCTGAFVLGAAGLLDDRRCTTHWAHAEELAQRYPRAKVDPSVLYVDDDPVITSAGTAAGIDACLYLVRKEQGSKVANAIARRMVVPPHRDGGQAQFVERPVAGPATDSLADMLNWMERHLDRPVTIDDLADRASMSARTFARRFVAETGTTPQRWLTSQRILLAQELLEETDATIDAVAERSGFGNATALRHHFRIWRSTTPQAYRRQFRDPAASSTG